MIWIIILSIVALIVVLGLSGYAIRLLKQLKQQNIMIAKSKAIREARLKESIDIIARAMQSGECNHSEGVIRLTMLLMPFGKTLTPYPSMAQLHEIVHNMPTHDARKQLEKKERMRLDLARERAEAKFEHKIKEELRQFLDDIKQIGVI